MYAYVCMYERDRVYEIKCCVKSRGSFRCDLKEANLYLREGKMIFSGFNEKKEPDNSQH